MSSMSQMVGLESFTRSMATCSSEQLVKEHLSPVLFIFLRTEYADMRAILKTGLEQIQAAEETCYFIHKGG